MAFVSISCESSLAISIRRYKTKKSRYATNTASITGHFYEDNYLVIAASKQHSIQQKQHIFHNHKECHTTGIQKLHLKLEFQLTNEEIFHD